MNRLVIVFLLFLSANIYAQDNIKLSDTLYIYFSENKDQSKYEYISSSALQGEMVLYNFYPEGEKNQNKTLFFIKTDYMNYEDYGTGNKTTIQHISKACLARKRLIDIDFMKKYGYEHFCKDFSNKKYFIVEKVAGKKDEFIMCEVNFLTATRPGE